MNCRNRVAWAALSASPVAGRLWPAMLATCGLLVGSASAQAIDGLSFERAQALATERAPMIMARRASVEAARYLEAVADQLPDPRLTLGIDNLPISGADRFSLSREPMTQRSMGWLQEMPNRDKRDARALGAQARSERELASLEVDRLGVRREVAQAWAARYFAERQLGLFKALLDENRLLRGTVDARIAAGRAAPADSTMARQESLLLSDRRDELARAQAQAQATLRRWLGDEAELPLAGALPALAAEAQDLHRGIDRHADVLWFEPVARMTQAEVQELEASRKGDWNWQLAYSKRGSTYGDMVSLQIGFDLPLWQASRQDPQIAAKRKEAERLGAEREELMRRRREEIDLQLADLDEVTRKLDRLQAMATPLAHERMALALAAYEAARGDLAGVLAARRERAELGLRLVELEARQFALRAKLNFFVAEPRR